MATAMAMSMAVTMAITMAIPMVLLVILKRQVTCQTDKPVATAVDRIRQEEMSEEGKGEDKRTGRGGREVDSD